jgi:hypothetical protein
MLEPVAARQICSSLKLAGGEGLVGEASNRSISVAGLGFALLLQGKPQPFDVKAFHRRKLPGHQRNVVDAFVSKHAFIVSLHAQRLKLFLSGASPKYIAPGGSSQQSAFSPNLGYRKGRKGREGAKKNHRRERGGRRGKNDDLTLRCQPRLNRNGRKGLEQVSHCLCNKRA